MFKTAADNITNGVTLTGNVQRAIQAFQQAAGHFQTAGEKFYDFATQLSAAVNADLTGDDEANKVTDVNQLNSIKAAFKDAAEAFGNKMVSGVDESAAQRLVEFATALQTATSEGDTQLTTLASQVTTISSDDHTAIKTQFNTAATSFKNAVNDLYNAIKNVV